jgi:hypothetical protein
LPANGAVRSAAVIVPGRSATAPPRSSARGRHAGTRAPGCLLRWAELRNGERRGVHTAATPRRAGRHQRDDDRGGHSCGTEVQVRHRRVQEAEHPRGAPKARGVGDTARAPSPTTTPTSATRRFGVMLLSAQRLSERDAGTTRAVTRPHGMALAASDRKTAGSSLDHRGQPAHGNRSGAVHRALSAPPHRPVRMG